VAQGPILIFDESALQSLNVDEPNVARQFLRDEYHVNQAKDFQSMLEAKLPENAVSCPVAAKPARTTTQITMPPLAAT
jgi:hypothetical protein